MNNLERASCLLMLILCAVWSAALARLVTYLFT